MLKSDDVNISFTSNTAKFAGNSIFFDSTGSVRSCSNDRIVGVSDKIHLIDTPPSKLEFYDPAICTDNQQKNAIYTFLIM